MKACVNDLGSQNLANIVRAFATAGHASSVLFDATSEVAKACSKDYNSQELANTMWAYAIASHASPEWKRHELAKIGIK
eukprot:2453105-Karenia_brevis.AAC.1